ncbi:MAG: Do family serine endopeptidase [Melioribacteraceae bacterium]|nr:Do family serine endopeptidase [Melioribacteraceae bacterium]
MKFNKLMGTFALVLIGVIFGAVLVSNFGWVRPSSAEVQIGSDKAPVKTVNIDAVNFNNAFIEVAEKVNPSIVQIKVVTTRKMENPHKDMEFFFPFKFKDNMPQQQVGGGSGILISNEGYILTNNHVVENADDVEVTLHDKRKFDAKVIGTDPMTDLAVIKIEGDNLVVAHLGNSDDAKIGQWVMAVGNPLSFASTVTAGIISAKNRSLNIIQGKDGYSGIENFIQTDAAINPGNSGGALVDLTGSVIGINTAIATNGMQSSYIGYGFAIPMNLAKAVAEDLIENGSVRRGYIGVLLGEVTDAIAKYHGFDTPKGILFNSIMEDGAAAEADIKDGDILLEIDDREINSIGDLQSYVASQRAGDEVKLKLFRDGEEIVRKVVLKARDDEKSPSIAADKKENKSEDSSKLKVKEYEKLGMTVKNLTDEQKEKFDLKYGILVSDVKMYGNAYDQRLLKGTIILEVDKIEVAAVGDFDEIIEAKKGKSILMRVVDIDNEGNQRKRFIGLDIPE